jgi:homogentisate 1,2-dioxygenase
MPFYIKKGSVPNKRHTQHRDQNGNLYHEELISREGFSDIYSNVYHIHPPTRISKYGEFRKIKLHPVENYVHRHRHWETFKLNEKGNWAEDRKVLSFNNDVVMSIAKPKENHDFYYRNANADEMIFVHKGNGKLISQFGELNFIEGDYIIIPGGILYKLEFSSKNNHLLIIESFGPIQPPKRYLNKFGQLMEHAPFCERDIRTPEFIEPVNKLGDFPIKVKLRDGMQDIILAHHPCDLVGWDGYYYPWILNIKDFMPIVGKIHQPPPVHQTFSGPGFVICSFVPRLFDFHEKSIPAPYNHSNVDSDEVLYYFEGDFMSRKGVSLGSITLHPSGFPHGPQPGKYEGSIGKKETFEYAVMLDTYKPLIVAKDAEEIDDPKYPFSWME